MTETKVIIESLATLAKRKAGECKGDGCYGRGCIYPNFTRPCPDCADLRRVAEMKWEHECIDDGCEICRGLTSMNPTLTVFEVRELMQVVGVWNRFIVFIWHDTHAEVGWKWLPVETFADILTSPAFFAEAARFLKGEASHES